MIDQDSETLKVYPGNDDPSNVAKPIKHGFRDEQDLQSYILKTVFGRKKAF